MDMYENGHILSVGFRVERKFINIECRNVLWENQNMSECRLCHGDTATYRANIRVCQIHGILNPQELYRLLRNLKISEALIEKIKFEIGTSP